MPTQMSPLVEALLDMARERANLCEVCENRTFAFVVHLKGKPSSKLAHGPDCTCTTKGARIFSCAKCKDDIVRCSEGKCPEGQDCAVASVTVQTLLEATEEAIAPQAVALGIPSSVLRFGIRYNMPPSLALDVVQAIEAAGGKIDFSKIGPDISFPASVGANARNRKGAPPRPTYPDPIVVTPFDGNIH